ncbi:MAG: prepilin peptidase [Agromyces sp.]
MTVFAAPLVWRDLREHRLPNRLTMPLFGLQCATLSVAALALNEWGRLGTALLGSLAMTAVYVVLSMVPGGMGFGDVKLALSIGLVTAWWSWNAWGLALIAAFVFGSVGAVWAAIRGRGFQHHIAFGPAMLLGWAAAALAALA